MVQLSAYRCLTNRQLGQYLSCLHTSVLPLVWVPTQQGSRKMSIPAATALLVLSEIRSDSRSSKDAQSALDPSIRIWYWNATL